MLLYTMASVPFELPLKLHHVQILSAAGAVLFVVAAVFVLALSGSKTLPHALGPVTNFGRFFYASFLKPHTGDRAGMGQQAALESFYKAQVRRMLFDTSVPRLMRVIIQADVYDATRKKLLRGREDMLGLVAAQLKHKAHRDGDFHTKPIWVDVSRLKETRTKHRRHTN